MNTSVGKTYTKGYSVLIALVDPLAGKQLYAWQKEVLQLVEGEPDDRKIYWYWSDKGGIGKSVLVKHMCLKDRQYTLLCGGSAKDLKYAVAVAVRKKMPPRVVLFDIARAKQVDGKPCISYAGMEDVKNGCFFTGKYEGGMCIYNVPHLVVFANVGPDEEKMSGDRWVVKNLDKGYAQRNNQYVFD